MRIQWLALLLSAPVIAACDEPLDPDALAVVVGDQAAEIVSSASRAQTASKPVYDDAARTLDSVAFMRTMMPGLGFHHQQPRDTGVVAKLSEFAARLSPVLPAGSDDVTWGNKVRTLLRDRLLTAGNLESKSDDDAIYLLRPGLTCRDLVTGAPLDDCAELLGKVEIRIRLMRSGDGAALTWLVGPHRAIPGTVYVSSHELAIELHLAETKKAVALIAAASGSGDGNTLPAMLGTVRVGLRRDGAREVTFSTSILETLELLDHAAGTLFRSAVAQPALAIHLDGERGTISGKVALGATEVTLPWRPEGQPIGSDSLHVVLGGLTGEATVDAANPHAVFIKQVGFGPGASFAEVRGQRIFQLDLNAMNGRSVDLALQVAADGMPSLRLSPRLDLLMMWNLAAVASDFTTPPPSHLLDESYRLALEPVGARAPRLARTAAAPDALVVAEGTFTLSSSRVSTPVRAEAGQCITAGSPAGGEHPVLGALTVAACP